MDLAEVNGRTFLNNVSLGLYATIVASDAYRDAKVDTALAAKVGEGGEWTQSPLAKTITPALRGEINATCNPKTGDLVLFHILQKGGDILALLGGGVGLRLETAGAGLRLGDGGDALLRTRL